MMCAWQHNLIDVVTPSFIPGNIWAESIAGTFLILFISTSLYITAKFKGICNHKFKKTTCEQLLKRAEK